MALCVAGLEGEHGLKWVYCGVPCVLGVYGLERIIVPELTADERAGLERSGGGGAGDDGVVRV